MKLGEEYSFIFASALSLCSVSCKEVPSLLLLDMKGGF
jgi:hypothetical protein